MDKIFEYITEIKERVDADSTVSMSNYPNDIDPLLFIEDTRLSNLEWRKNYETLLNCDVTNAIDLLSLNKQFVPINAFLINNIQDRIIATQKYLLEKEDTMERIEFGEEPSTYVDGKTWLIPK